MRQGPRIHSLGPLSPARSRGDTHLTGLLSTPQREQHQGEVGLGDTCLEKKNSVVAQGPDLQRSPSLCPPTLA